ncbi:transferase family-domain-containing protein [Xylaria sp. FL1042]|nr:transferase family-domain-containing protein [Xylaria sp. FL1042]
MKESPAPEWLSPLDLLMPRTYITVMFTFRTKDSTVSIRQSLQRGLDGLSKDIPWLTGRIFPTTPTDEHAPGLKIQYGSENTTFTLLDKGTIDVPYATLSAEGLPPDAIPSDVWPLPSMIDEHLFTSGAPIFGASMFRFADDQAVGVCVSVHHNAVDATGLAHIVKIWVEHIAGSAPSCIIQNGDRHTCLSNMLRAHLPTISSQSAETLFELHPEYSKMPPAFPSEFPACASKIFRLPVTHLNAYKEQLNGHLSNTPSINALVCALVWSAISRARLRRFPALKYENSRLAMAVNGRQRLGEEFSTPENPYLGNTILYALAHSSVSDLDSAIEGSFVSLARICDVVAQSQSSTKIDSHHIAEVYSLVERMDDYRKIFPGWDLFSSRDLTITSWANLELYGMSFGMELGKPDFIRIPSSVADGVVIILPRKGESVVKGEELEIMIMLKKDDMDVLEQDSRWKSFVAGVF